ncbi:MAG: hypothetical protein ACJ798_07335 [Phenylobacterium sp.]
MKTILAVAMAVLALAGGAQAAPASWSGIDWLAGRWIAAGGGAEQGTGGFSFLPDAGGTVLVRRNVADYPAQNGRPASHHEDLMVIFHEGPALRATYWDSEGQTIHYAVSAPEPGAVLFVSDDPAGPRFRLTYRRTPKGLDGSFEIAPPPGRDQFRNYLTWKAERAR